MEKVSNVVFLYLSHVIVKTSIKHCMMQKRRKERSAKTQ